MSASTEIRRLRYLAAMGVPVYVTRRPLPGAAVTAKLAWRQASQSTDNGRTEAAPHTTPAAFDTTPVAFDTTAVALNRTAAGPDATAKALNKAASPRTPAAAQALRESLRHDAKQGVSARRTGGAADASDLPGAGQSPAQAATQSPRFRLAAIVFAQRLWVEELGDEALASEQLQLILAIGRALMHPDESVAQPAVTEFRWPMHDNVQLGLGADEAAATLQGFLHRQLDDNACVEMICLGEAARRLLGSLSVPCARRFILSTREVLDSPLLKRDVWAALQA